MTTATKVVATYDGRQVTYKDFVGWFDLYRTMRRIPMSLEDLLGRSPDAAKQMGEEMALVDLYSKKARAAGLEKTPETKEQLEKVRFSNLQRGLQQKILFDAVQPISEKEAREYYDKNKAEYQVPFSFKMRYIYLSTYEHYEAKEGDDLEGIAKKISGESSAVDRILSDSDDKSPRWVPPAERATREFVALKPGEKLLVPMNSEKAAAVGKHMEQIMADIKAGKTTFEQAAAEYSESDFKDKEMGPLPQGDKMILPDILEAAKKTPVNGISDVTRTKHGYQALQVTSKQEERQKTFDEVKDTIIQKRLLQDRTDRANSYTRDLFNMPEIKIDFAKLADPSTSDSAVVITFGEHQWKKGDLGDGPQMRLKADNTPAEREGNLRELPGLWPALLEWAGNKEKVADTQVFKENYEFAANQVLAGTYMNTYLRDHLTTSEAEYKDYYEKHKEDRYKKAMTYTVRQIVIKVIEPDSDTGKPQDTDALTSKALETLKKVRETAQTIEEFIEAVKEYSQDPGTVKDGGLLKDIPTGYRLGSFQDALKTLEKPGDMSHPFVYGAFAYLLRLEEINPEMIRPYEEVRSALERDYAQAKRSEIALALRGEVLKEANFEFKGLP
ncbi:MAG: peptidyl-prolyl cis-trans isomerase [bacterium]